MKVNNLIITLLSGCAMAFAGCQTEDENEQHYDNKLFLSTTGFTKEIMFQAGSPDVETRLSVAIAKPEAHDIKATLAAAPEMLSTYKAIYGDDAAILLPSEHYMLTASSVTIPAGGLNSDELPIKFVNTNALDMNTVYVLPVTITSVEGIEVLRSAKTFYYIFKGASLINVVCNISRNCAFPDFNDDPKFNNLSENTMEILFKANAFPNTLNTLMGIEGNYLLRLGDAGVPSNQLQVATSGGNLTSTDLQFESGVWYHVAVTFSRGGIKVYVNGQEKLSSSVSISSVSIGAAHSDEANGKPRCFWIGYSYNNDRFFDGVVSEVRIWNRALSAEEIQSANHFYTVAADSEGLISYWKFNEGAGQTVKDYSLSGYNLTIEKEPTWEAVSLPEK